jgi:hypothetical protein
MAAHLGGDGIVDGDRNAEPPALREHVVIEIVE